jgi:hypothetical protein
MLIIDFDSIIELDVEVIGPLVVQLPINVSVDE